MTNEGSQSLRSFFSDHYRPLRLRGKTIAAVRLHNVTINNFAHFLCREPLLSDLTDDTVGRFLCWLRDRGRAACTANDNLNRLGALWRFANRLKLVDSWPNVLPEPEPEVRPQAWTLDEMSALLDAAKKMPGQVAGIQAGNWWHAALSLCYWTGERIGAVLLLEWSFFDERHARLDFPAHVRKGKREFNTIPLSPDAVAALASISSPKRKLIFPWSMSLGTLYNHYSRILRSAGLPNDRASKFHRIRKTAASHYEANGGNATEFLGHSTRRVTKKYLDPKIVGGPQPDKLLPRPRAS